MQVQVRVRASQGVCPDKPVEFPTHSTSSLPTQPPDSCHRDDPGDLGPELDDDDDNTSVASIDDDLPADFSSLEIFMQHLSNAQRTLAQLANIRGQIPGHCVKYTGCTVNGQRSHHSQFLDAQMLETGSETKELSP
ncbi:uncharacterized protein EI90DRAFT_3115053 [Cantharellus anzutake]|uniref:uncharacterized protein n=1 Tax=Cantharellus anzutake TaxID=1750568 RepID=UPI00190384A2|nr:uncharacterized protein EI90DRAFT_3115053 [Cantharellus anzutake]KAF8344296.1 hypothetical protein EI90DRAFT_3115053 [Cantharellus anzutake]